MLAESVASVHQHAGSTLNPGAGWDVLAGGSQDVPPDACTATTTVMTEACGRVLGVSPGQSVDKEGKVLG